MKSLVGEGVNGELIEWYVGMVEFVGGKRNVYW